MRSHHIESCKLTPSPFIECLDKTDRREIRGAWVYTGPAEVRQVSAEG
jgi:hypothetical protein